MNDEAAIKRAQHELENNWSRALRFNLSRLDAMCAEVCADLEPELSDVPTWEQLLPLYREIT